MNFKVETKDSTFLSHCAGQFGFLQNNWSFTNSNLLSQAGQTTGGIISLKSVSLSKYIIYYRRFLNLCQELFLELVPKVEIKI